MGRELRKVIPNWEHPLNGTGQYQEMFDIFYENEGEVEPKYCLPPSIKNIDKTWFQVYETVSAGTPITPPFETKNELIEWMVRNKDFWGEQWTREQAEYFANESGFAFTGCIDTGKGTFKLGYEVIPC